MVLFSHFSIPGPVSPETLTVKQDPTTWPLTLFPHGEAGKPSLLPPRLGLAEDDAALLEDLGEQIERRPACDGVPGEQVPDGLVVC